MATLCTYSLHNHPATVFLCFLLNLTMIYISDPTMFLLCCYIVFRCLSLCHIISTTILSFELCSEYVLPHFSIMLSTPTLSWFSPNTHSHNVSTVSCYIHTYNAFFMSCYSHPYMVFHCLML